MGRLSFRRGGIYQRKSITNIPRKSEQISCNLLAMKCSSISRPVQVLEVLPSLDRTEPKISGFCSGTQAWTAGLWSFPVVGLSPFFGLPVVRFFRL